MIEKFFTTEQVASILQVHPFTILRFIKEGKLRGVKLGRVYRIKESDVHEFLERRTVGSSASNNASSKRSHHEDGQEPQEPPKDHASPYKLDHKKDDKDDEHYYII